MSKSKSNAKTSLSGSRLIAILTPFAILACIGFPIASLFFGFSNLTVTCERPQPAQAPNCEATERRLFGIFNYHAAAQNVTGIGYATQDVNASAGVTLSSTVVLSTPGKEVPVSEVSTSFGEKWKSELILKMQQYLDSPNEISFNYKVFSQSVFGWIGAAMIGFIVWSYVIWFMKKQRGAPKGK